MHVLYMTFTAYYHILSCTVVDPVVVIAEATTTTRSRSTTQLTLTLDIPMYLLFIHHNYLL